MTNILWQKRVWRQIDVREKGNEDFNFNPDASRNSVNLRASASCCPAAV